MLALIALCSSALASDPVGVNLAVGADWVTNDPFLRRRGMHFTGEYAPDPVVAFGGLVAFYPNLGQMDWKPLTTQLVNENHVSPDIARIMARGELYARVVPLRREGEHLDTNVGLHAGLGMVRTVDDLEALQAEGDPRADSTAVQLHPTVVYGLTAEMRTSVHVGFRIRSEAVSFIETVYGTTVEYKTNRFFGGEVVAWF